MSNIIVIGSANSDLVMTLPNIPQSGETLLGGEFNIYPGGKGANQAVAAAKAGGDVTFLGCIGDDDFGQQTLASLNSYGIETDCIKTVTNCASGVALIFVDHQANSSIGVASGANNELSETYVQRYQTQIEQAACVLMQLETPINSNIIAAKIAQQAGAITILDPAPAQDLPEALLQHIDIITPNETEAKQLTGLSINTPEDAKHAAKRLARQGVKNVLITMGSKGVYVKTPEQEAFIPAFTVDSVDTTAAGDTFNGALSVALTRGDDLFDAVKFACAAAAISTSRQGAQPSIPSVEDIDKFLLSRG